MVYRGTIKDKELLQRIGRSTFQDTFGGTCTRADMAYVLEKYFNDAQCEQELQDESDNFFFLEEEGMVKGYIRINAKNEVPDGLPTERWIELVRLYVLKEFHGTNVATDLMQFAFEFATQGHYTGMYLSVWEYNFRARGFYEKMGFTNTGIENDFPLGETPQTDYWFIKKLA